MKTAPAMTPTTATAIEPLIPLPMLPPGEPLPFPLKELGEAEDEEPLDELLEAGGFEDVTVTPNALVVALPVGLVTEPDLFGNKLLSVRRNEETHAR